MLTAISYALTVNVWSSVLVMWLEWKLALCERVLIFVCFYFPYFINKSIYNHTDELFDCAVTETFVTAD